MDTMIRAAIGYGFRAIGFSEHSYAPLQSSYCMPPEKTDDYFREIRGRSGYSADLSLTRTPNFRTTGPTTS